jgi:hypothetical protein
MTVRRRTSACAVRWHSGHRPLAEPYQLGCSASKRTIVPRRVSGDPQQIGQPIAGTYVPPHGGYPEFVKSYCRTETGGVIKVRDLAWDLAHVPGVAGNGGFGAGDFAIQMVKAPERQSFLPRKARELT